MICVQYKGGRQKLVVAYFDGATQMQSRMTTAELMIYVLRWNWLVSDLVVLWMSKVCRKIFVSEEKLLKNRSHWFVFKRHHHQNICCRKVAYTDVLVVIK